MTPCVAYRARTCSAEVTMMAIVLVAVCSLSIVFLTTVLYQKKSGRNGKEFPAILSRGGCKPDPYRGNCKKLCSASCDFEKTTVEDCECCSLFYKRCRGDLCECYQPLGASNSMVDTSTCQPNCNLFGDMKSCDQHGILHHLTWCVYLGQFRMRLKKSIAPLASALTFSTCW